MHPSGRRGQVAGRALSHILGRALGHAPGCALGPILGSIAGMSWQVQNSSSERRFRADTHADYFPIGLVGQGSARAKGYQRPAGGTGAEQRRAAQRGRAHTESGRQMKDETQRAASGGDDRHGIGQGEAGGGATGCGARWGPGGWGDGCRAHGARHGGQGRGRRPASGTIAQLEILMVARGERPGRRRRGVKSPRLVAVGAPRHGEYEVNRAPTAPTIMRAVPVVERASTMRPTPIEPKATATHGAPHRRASEATERG